MASNVQPSRTPPPILNNSVSRWLLLSLLALLTSGSLLQGGGEEVGPSASTSHHSAVRRAAAASPPAANFKCYKGRIAKGAPKFDKRSVTLADEFETKNTTVSQPSSFCAPVDNSGSGIPDPAAHLTCYGITALKGQAKFVPRTLDIVNQFGTSRVAVKGGLSGLCVPSQLGTQPVPPLLDHFKCYKAVRPKGVPKFDKRWVTLADEFETKNEAVLGPVSICNPVNESGSGIPDANTHLACYKISRPNGEPRFVPRNLAVGNQFGPQVLTATESNLLCIPSLLVNPTLPTATPTATLRPATETPTAAQTGVCGDGVVNQPAEQCDPPQDSACPGRCQADCTCCPVPAITTIGPLSGSVGSAVTITGSGLNCGGAANVRLACGGQPMVITSLSPTTITSFVPLGAQDCLISITTGGGTFIAPDSLMFDVVLSRDFSLVVAPADGTVIQGSSTTYRVSAQGTNGFTDLIALAVMGLPAGVSAGFSPGTITAGQSATLTVRATDTATTGVVSFAITGVAKIDAVDVQHSRSANLAVANKGQTTLVGRILDTDGLPIKGVGIEVGLKSAPTDDNGNFLLSDPPVGNQVVLVDGGPASTPDAHYPTIPVGLTIVAGATNELPYVPHLHVQKNFNFTPITPAQDTIATDPDMPDVALRIPAGTQIIGWDGQANQMVSMRTVPVGSLPVRPLPPNVETKTVYMFYFNKRGGGIPTQPIPFVAANDLGLAPGNKAELWYFDESPISGQAPNDWRMAGTGTVSADGKTIVTDPGVGIPKFCCGAAAWNNGRAGGGANGGDTPPPGGPSGGEPVDLSTGIFMFTATDMVLPGRIPVAITRTYRSGDSRPGPFGIGTTMSYGDFLQQTGADVLTYVYRGNARLQFFRESDGSYVNNAVPAFLGTRITVASDGTWQMRFRDGTTNVFDSNGLQIRIRDRNNNEVVIKRQVYTDPSKIIEPSGRALTIGWALSARDKATSVSDPIGRTLRYDYDGQNRLIAVTNPEGGVTQYGYDSEHRMTSITDARGITYLRNTYDANSRVCEQELADGGKFQFYYVTSDQSTLPPSMQLLDEAAAGGPISIPPCSAQPTNGIVVATVLVDPLGHPTTYRFNGAGYLISVTDPLGQTTRMERDATTNLVLAVKGVASCPVCGGSGPGDQTFAYDANGNRLYRVDALGNTTSFTYESAFNKVTSITDALGHVTQFTYDFRGNLLTLTDPSGNTTSFGYDGVAQLISITDPLGNVWRITYDARGNPATVTDPLGNAGRLAYDLVSRLTALTNPRGRTMQFAYDGRDRIVQTVDALNGATHFTYDAIGNLLAVTDALSHTTTHAYDSVGRLSRRTDPLGAVESFDYDVAGNLIRRTDRKGQLTTYAYDPLNRRAGAVYADGAATNFVYNARGRVAQASDSVGGDILRSYDALDRLKEERTNLGTVEYVYDGLGRRSIMTVTGQPPVNYSYDVNSRLTQVSQGGQVASFVYDALGRRTSLTLPNGVVTEYKYDAASRLTELMYRNISSVLGNLTYQYDAAGHRVEVGGSFARTLLPDPVASSSYDAADRQLQFADKHMTFDANGSLISSTDASGTTTFTWDARNQLTQLVSPFITARFAYDARGRRIFRDINGRQAHFLHDRTDIVQELSGGTAINGLGSLRIDEPLGRSLNEYFLADALGSVVALTDPSGRISDYYTYDPYGATTAIGTSTNPFNFTGRENDGGLYYYRARYYSSTTGRFIQQDPYRATLLGAGITNSYQYVRNDPMNLVDPSGEIWFAAIAGYVAGTLIVTITLGELLEGLELLNESRLEPLREQRRAAGGCNGPVAIQGIDAIQAELQELQEEISREEFQSQFTGRGTSEHVEPGNDVREFSETNPFDAEAP